MNKFKEILMSDYEIKNNSRHIIVTVVWVLLTLAVIVAVLGTFLTAF